MSKSLDGFFEQNRNPLEEERDRREDAEAEFQDRRDLVKEQRVSFQLGSISRQLHTR